MSLENVEVVRACFEAFDRGDLRGAADRLDPDVEWDNSVLIDEPVLHGREAVLEYWERILATFPFAHEQHRFLEAGEQVCVLAELRAHGAGSGVEMAAPCGYAMTVRDGAIVRACFFRSQPEALEAVGLSG
jgi:ketosteroid isomerase-like protein